MLRMILNAKRRNLTTASSNERSTEEVESQEVATTLEPWPDFFPVRAQAQGSCCPVKPLGFPIPKGVLM